MMRRENWIIVILDGHGWCEEGSSMASGKPFGALDSSRC